MTCGRTRPTRCAGGTSDSRVTRSGSRFSYSSSTTSSRRTTPRVHFGKSLGARVPTNSARVSLSDPGCRPCRVSFPTTSGRRRSSPKSVRVQGPLVSFQGVFPTPGSAGTVSRDDRSLETGTETRVDSRVVGGCRRGHREVRRSRGSRYRRVRTCHSSRTERSHWDRM